MRIRQNLMALPGQEIGDIREVRTHYMAMNQTREFFSGCPWIRLVESEDTAKSAAEVASERLEGVGAFLQSWNALLYMAAEDHDVHAAYVSLISHVTSFALALTVLDKEKDERHIFDLASGGFSSTVRLAKSSPDMWTPVLAMNRDNVLEVMDTYMSKMRMFRDAVASGDNDAVHELIARANIIRRIIK